MIEELQEKLSTINNELKSVKSDIVKKNSIIKDLEKRKYFLAFVFYSKSLMLTIINITATSNTDSGYLDMCTLLEKMISILKKITTANAGLNIFCNLQKLEFWILRQNFFAKLVLKVFYINLRVCGIRVGHTTFKTVAAQKFQNFVGRLLVFRS